MTDDSFVFTVPTMSEKQDLYEFLLKYFLSQESMNKAARMTAEQFSPIANEVVEKSLQVPFSVVARHKESNEIAGLLLQSLWKRGLDSDNEYDFSMPSSSAVGSIGKILNELHNSLYNLVPSEINCVLHREMSCVAQKYQRRGIAKKMAHYHIGNPQLKEYGIQGIASETTSHANQTLLKSLGYTILKEVWFKDILDNEGNPTLKCEDGTEKAVLNYLQL